MKHIIPIIFITMLLAGCRQNESIKEFSFTTSDMSLQETFDWAKQMALSYAGHAADPVGPWYEASLPDREAFCMRDVSHQCRGAEALGLSNENLNMFTRFASNISGGKDWCTFWEINRYNLPAPEDYRNDREFWYNLNANFDVLDACYRTYLWTGDRQYIDDPAFLYFYEKTMTDYIERWQLQADKIMSRPRFMNTPDTFDISDSFHKCRGLASYVENFEGLTVSADLIAILFRACKSYSGILRLKGDMAKSDHYGQMAQAYARLFEAGWWDGTQNLYHTFLTDSGKFYKGEGETFILWYGISENRERITATIDHLLDNSWNVENLSYFPRLLYDYSYDRNAYRTLLSLPSMARSEYPEVSYGVIDGIVGGLSGISADAGKNMIITLPRLDQSTEWVDLQYLPVLGEAVSVRHEKNRSTTLTSHCRQPLSWKAVFPGDHPVISKDGKQQNAAKETDVMGNIYSFITVQVGPGEKVTITI